MDCLANISEEDVKDCCEYKVFRRGMEYFDEGLVEDMVHNLANNTVVATVRGSSDYRIEFYLKDESIYSTCDCPYPDVCKHTVAALLCIVNNGTDDIISHQMASPSSLESLDFLGKYLESLSKEDLVQLVLKFAPLDFINSIQNRELSEEDALGIFRKVEKKVRNFFGEEEMLYDPERMEGALMSQLETLTGLEARIPNKIWELIIYIIRSINEAFDEGYLFTENYYDGDVYFESEGFCEYVIAFVRQMLFAVKIKYILELDQVLNEMSYDTFYTIEKSFHRLFLDSEKSELKSVITSDPASLISLISRVYNFLESELDTSEREAILRMISKTKQEHFINMLRLLHDQGRFKEVMDEVMDDSGNTYRLGDYEVAVIFLEAAHGLHLDMEKVSEKAAAKCPRAGLLKKIKSLKGTVGEKIEEIVKQRNPQELLSFYEEENRLKDAFGLVQEKLIYDDWEVFSFYKKNGKQFPKEAELFLINRIEKDLNHTGRSYYDRIAESLDLMSRINPIRSRRIADQIRADFKRRKSLLAIIREY